LLAACLVLGFTSGSEGGPPARPDQEAGRLGPARTDRHGDPLPDGAFARLGTLRWRARGEVEALAFAPDGKTVASASSEGLCLFEAAGLGRGER